MLSVAAPDFCLDWLQQGSDKQHRHDEQQFKCERERSAGD
jgi:hypothetical protein